MATCVCDNLSGPDCLDIPAGLTTVPRQFLAFADFRRNMKFEISAKPELSQWSAEGEQDLGVMLLDMWAYVLDISQFYDNIISNESYLLTCKLDQSASDVIGLFGYRPGAAMSASISLVGQVGGAGEIKVPAGTAFRSEAFDDQAPQIFTTLSDHMLRPEYNMWQISDMPGDEFPGKILFRPRHSSVPRSGVLAFRHGSDAIHASQILSVNSVTGPDERTFINVNLENGHGPLEGLSLDNLKVRLLGRKAGPTDYNYGTFSATKLVLDGVYPRLRVGHMAALEVAGIYYPFIIQSVRRIQVIVAENPPIEITVEADGSPDEIVTVPQTDVTASASEVTIPSLSGLTLTASTNYILHFYPVRIGRLVAPAKTEISLSDIEMETALEKPRVNLTSSVTSDLIIQGQKPLGASLNGTVARSEADQDHEISPSGGNLEFPEPLQTPVRVYGNLIMATRAERVKYEVLGSVTGLEVELKFKLKKSPLSWIADGNASGGKRPLLDVYVNSVRWDRVESLYTAGPADRVYVVETDLEQNSFIVFGRGKKGERPATGVKNIIADYHIGAGAPKPPADGIKQVVGSVKGLKKIKSPVMAEGGKDADTAQDIKKNAPLKMLTLGRAVSVQDFEALARDFPGIVNVSAGWSWSRSRQAGVVSLWAIGDSGSINTEALQKWLADQAANDMQIEVLNATGDLKSLSISIEISPGHNAENTLASIKSTLLDEKTGWLAYRNIPIGLPIYRSELLARIHDLEGVENVSSILVDGVEMEWAMQPQAGHYFDFTSNLVVS